MRNPTLPAAALCLLIALAAVPRTSLAERKKHQPGSLSEKVDRTLSYAVDGIQPFVKQGFTIREEYWSGELGATTQNVITIQLFKGNEYWFCASTEATNTVISVHVYDDDGNIAESEYWRKAHAAGAHIVPRRTAFYYVITDMQNAPPKSRWSLIYAFR